MRAMWVGASLGWAAVLALLAWAMPANHGFVDEPAAAALLWVLPPLLGGLALGLVGGLIGALRRRPPRVGGAMARWSPRLAAALAGVTLLALVIGLASPPRRLHTELMVFGIDGATWTVIDTLSALEMVPELDRMRDEGASGVLRSLEPMLSPIVWTTIASGLPMDRHGIAGFHVHNDECEAARFWDVFEDQGKVVGTYKWLVTYPPREIEGFMVPAWLATGPEVIPADLAYTRAFEQQRRARQQGHGGASGPPVSSASYLSRGVRDGLRLSTLVAIVRFTLAGKLGGSSEDERLLGVHMLRARIDRDLFFGLLERFDPHVATFTYYPTDAVAHRMWRHYEPDRFGGVGQSSQELWDAIPATYRQADAILGELRDRLPAGATLLVLSDHGMCAAGSEGGASVYGIRAGEVDRVLQAAGAEVDVAQVGMKATVAVGAGGTLTPAMVREQLAAFRLGDAGLFEIEALSDAVFGLTLAPRGDVQARAAEPVSLPDGSTVPLETFLRMRADYSGVHHEEGIVLLDGPGVQPGAEIAGADLYDVAPTLLASQGVPPSGEMVGRVWTEAYETPPTVGEGPASYGDLLGGLSFVGVETSDEGAAALEERLRALGYVDTPAPAPGEGG